ncbi:hypothetical protein BDF19DRAFT_389981 [Syncephalis fuscata]|nr:hypothetical protein BDF19DRAFT_389981 [Syncephalis fuscata]
MLCYDNAAREHDSISRSPTSTRDTASSQQDSGEAKRNQGHNIYVAGLSYQTLEGDLEALFKEFGAIKRCQIMRDPQTQSHRGFAFVTMTDVQGARKAIEKLDGMELHRQRIRVELGKRARPRTPTPGQYLGPPKRSGM